MSLLVRREHVTFGPFFQSVTINFQNLTFRCVLSRFSRSEDILEMGD